MKLAGATRSLLAIAVSVLLYHCLGCAAHRSLNGPAYRLTETDSQYFLTTGAPPIRGQHQGFQISLGTESKEQHSLGDDCSIHDLWFSLYPAEPLAGPNWTVETPSVDAWAAAAGHTDLKLEWDKFLQKIIVLQQRHCFPPAENFIGIKQKIVEGMAMPAADALLYRYTFGQGGYVDLTAGMELRIERNLSTDAGTSQKKISILRTIITSYDFTNTAGNDTQINFIRSQDDLMEKVGDSPDIPDKTLATQFQSTPHLRLILQRLAVSASINSPAILLGASDVASLDQATQPAVDDPKITCAELKKFPVKCVDFSGLVTVSPVLKVKVNGHLSYAPLGSRIWYVFPPTVDSSSILRTLEIRRQYGNTYRNLQFARTEEEISQILLFGGDEISWSKSAHP